MRYKKKTARGVVKLQQFLITVVLMLFLYLALSYHFVGWQLPPFIKVAQYNSLESLESYWPRSSNGIEVVKGDGYTVGYDNSKKLALWVLYALYQENLEKPRFTRPKNSPFKVDSRLPNGSAHPSDYTNSGYDRGHLAPSADFSHSEELMRESFLMSNIAPQTPSLNRGEWKRLEDYVRKKHQQQGDLIVAVGPIFRNDRLTYIGTKNRIAVPDSFFKIIYHPYSGDTEAYIMNNSPEKQSLVQSLTSVTEIEALTGLTFFSYALP